MKAGYYRVTNSNIPPNIPADIWWMDEQNEESMKPYYETGYAFEEVVVMTPYDFNKNMKDAHNIGKHGPVECDLEDLLIYD